MAFKWISLWINGDSQSARAQRRRKPRARPRVEELEPRLALSDYYLVRGSSANMTSILFHYNSNGSGSTSFHDEIGVYEVGDDLGDIGTTKPTDSGYAAAALAIAKPIFTPTSPPGTDNVLQFRGDTLLGFYIVQNGTSAAATSDNSSDSLSSPGHVTFFSFQSANPDKTRHTMSALYGDGSGLVEMNDQTNGGDGSFPIQFTVGVAGGSGDSLTGQSGQTVPVTFDLTSRGSNTDELGVFSVDQPDGKIGNLEPGAPGWVNAALSNAHVVFTGGQGAGATNTINLPGGGLFGLYLVQDDTTADLLSKNPSDLSTLSPVEFSSFVGANPDQFQHLRWTNINTFTWDDQTGGGNQQFTALTGTISYGTPQGTTVQPVTISPTTLPGATAQQAYNQALTASGGTGTKTFAVSTGTLPTGLTLSSSGVLAGTPTTAGSFNFTATATDTQGNKGSQAYSVVVSPAFMFQAPVVTHPVSPISVSQNATPMTVDLAAHFGDPDIVDGNTTVTMNTSSGPINLTLFDASAPQSVANFVDYAQSGTYTNSFFHRLANLSQQMGTQVNSANPPQILQGGGFTVTQSTPTTLNSPTTAPGIANEFISTNPDVVNTIAMARTSSPNSATDQFFFNLTDNSSALGQGNGGGFAVFGKLADTTTSSSTLSTLSQVPTFNESTSGGSGASASVRGALTNIPLSSFTGGTNDANFPNDTTAANYEVINSVTVAQKDALTYSIVSNSAPNLVTPTFVASHGEQLTLTFAANQTGTAIIVVKATNKNGLNVNTTITVTIS
jgi:cyclophilin family peptidyl-prolyl cis-trans isomerase